MNNISSEGNAASGDIQFAVEVVVNRDSRIVGITVENPFAEGCAFRTFTRAKDRQSLRSAEFWEETLGEVGSRIPNQRKRSARTGKALAAGIHGASVASVINIHVNGTTGEITMLADSPLGEKRGRILTVMQGSDNYEITQEQIHTSAYWRHVLGRLGSRLVVS